MILSIPGLALDTFCSLLWFRYRINLKFVLFPEIILNSFVKRTTRYCYGLLVLSHDEISPLCLIQAFKISSHPNGEACLLQGDSKLYFDYSHLWGNFFTYKNARNIIGGAIKTYWSNMLYRHFGTVLFPNFCVSIRWLSITLKVTRNILRQD